MSNVVIRILLIAPDSRKVEEGCEIRRGGGIGTRKKEARQLEAGRVEMIEIRRKDGIPEPTSITKIHQCCIMNVVAEKKNAC